MPPIVEIVNECDTLKQRVEISRNMLKLQGKNDRYYGRMLRIANN